MTIYSKLPKDREQEGTLWVTDEAGATIFGPVRCRGEADNSQAAAHDNPSERPTKPYGDHPSGVYQVTSIVDKPQPSRVYGTGYITLLPVSGEALEAYQKGRRGIAIHGGDLNPQGGLRATYGCLRADNTTMVTLKRLVSATWEQGRKAYYECVVE